MEERKVRLLLIDKDQSYVERLQKLLSTASHKSSYEVVLASSLKEASTYLAEKWIDLVLLDLDLPDSKGFETLVSVHQQIPGLPIIVLTHEKNQELALQSLRYGAEDYLLKEDLSGDVLARSIHYSIARKQAEESLRRLKGELEGEVEQRTQHLRALSARLESIREEERSSLSREIHDQLGQQLTGIKIDLAWIQRHVLDDVVLKRIYSTLQLTDETIQMVRKIASILRPGVLDDLGLEAGLEWQAQQFQERVGIRCRLELGEEPLTLTRDQSTGVFRIYQEILTNVARHAHASEVNVCLRKQNDRLVMEVQDNGVGMTESQSLHSKSLGLLGMRERARLLGGELRFVGEEGRGTRVTLSVPLGAAGLDQ